MSDRLTTSKRLLYTSLTLAVASLLGFGIAEVALRIRHGSIEKITGVAPWRTGSYGDITYHWDRYHPRLGWTNEPGYRSGEDAPFRVTINSQRLRAERDYAPVPPPGVFRIAMLGDSTTFGEEVDDEHTVPAYLESRLPGSEVLNFGVHGYGAGQMLLRLEDEALDYAPDLVVVMYLTLDVYRDPVPEFVHPKPVFALDGGRLVVTNVPVPELSRQPWPVRHSFVAAWLAGRPPVTPDRAGAADHALLLARILARMREACAERDVPLLLVHVIDRNTLDAAGRDPSIRRAVETMRGVVLDAGEPVLDLTAILAEAYRLDRTGFTEPHGHWSERGNELIAGRIARHLRERALVPPVNGGG